MSHLDKSIEKYNLTLVLVTEDCDISIDRANALIAAISEFIKDLEQIKKEGEK